MFILLSIVLPVELPPVFRELASEKVVQLPIGEQVTIEGEEFAVHHMDGDGWEIQPALHPSFTPGLKPIRDEWASDIQNFENVNVIWNYENMDRMSQFFVPEKFFLNVGHWMVILMQSKKEWVCRVWHQYLKIILSMVLDLIFRKKN